MAVNSLRQQLKDHTQALHAQVDGHPMMRALCAPGLTQALYIKVLHAMDAALVQLEPLMVDAACPSGAVPPPPYRTRRAALQNDLAAMGALASPPGPQAAAGSSLAVYVGVRYVLDGARMGGLVLARSIERSLGPQVPTGFFRGEGAQTGPHWALFTAWMDDVAPHLDAQAAKTAATGAFGIFLQALGSGGLEMAASHPS
jgi:heme oxygenase